MATFVLVHGAFHGGWCWQRLTPYLQAAGHLVYTPTLTGLGERSHLLSPTINLTCHTQDVVNLVLYEDLEGVILVGHSYAGMVISGVADQCAARISRLVYLDAFVPENGETALDQWLDRSWLKIPKMPTSPEGWYIPTPSPEAMGVTDTEDAAWLAARMVPHPVNTQTEKLLLVNKAAESIPRTYILCSVNSPEMGKAVDRIKNHPLGQILTLETGHDAMITAPKEVAALLIGFAL